MKWVVRFAVIILSIAGGIYKMPVLPAASGDKDKSNIRYVALGDSIAHGYGLSNPDEDSYAGRVTTYLREHYDYVFSANLGEDGLRSDELLEWLTDENNENYQKCSQTLKNADVVTISIGSNDLLHLINLGPGMVQEIQREQYLFDEACDGFAVNFPQIIRAVKKISPKAKIYVGNIYNPCHGLALFEGVEAVAEEYIDKINKVFQDSEDYEVIDVKDAFSNSDRKLINMAVNLERVDPHPNIDGHSVIGGLIIKKLMEAGVY